ncbi:MAG: helix-turn-helix transcriptional regulator [Oscillospiraceae bacterium]|nr:helix-turn-helix transcriptional regulator [Oscillospiraceae bacterium]
MDYIIKLKQLRETKKLTQEQVGCILGCKKQQYMRYEKGQNEMKPHHLIALAKFYKVSTDYLLGLTDNPKGSWLE